MKWQLGSDGGSPLTGYKLYQTNTTSGGESVIYDGRNIPTVSSHEIKGLTSGHEYQYRVTAINRVGEGGFSPLSQIIIAATVPSRPEPPMFTHATQALIGLKLTPLTDNGGSAVIRYKLYADDGDINSDNFSEVTSFNGQTLEFEIQVAYEPRLVVGSIYRFKVSAVNSIGEGEQSNYVRVAVADPATTL